MGSVAAGNAFIIYAIFLLASAIPSAVLEDKGLSYGLVLLLSLLIRDSRGDRRLDRTVLDANVTAVKKQVAARYSLLADDHPRDAW